MRTRLFTFLAVASLSLATALSAQNVANPSNGPSAQTSFGESSLFNDGWRFIQKDLDGAAEPSFDDSHWTPTTLPHDWSIRGPYSPDNASCTGYLPAGIGWYRKHFSARFLHGENVYIYFEGVYNRSSVWLNGHLLGERPSGYNSFLYDLTPYLNRDGDNVLAVRVDHSRKADSRWYTGSGIYRNTWLVQSAKTHFDLWGVSYEATSITDKLALVKVSTSVEGLESGTKLIAKMFDADGKLVASSSASALEKQSLELKVKTPHRWDITDPYLYSIEVSLQKSGNTLDKTTISAGLRTLAFDANTGFALNGRNLKVKGVCLHHDAGVLGAVVPREVLKRRLEVLKSIGTNAIRTSHNPQSPDFYDLCDRLGLLVMDEAFDEWEFNKKKWVEGWNVGTPAMDGTADYFEQWCERDVRDMVLRDRNHPCVFMWSIGNEVDYPNDPYSHPILDGGNFEFTQPMSGGYLKDAPQAERIGKIAERLAPVVRAIDTSRPVTGALAGVAMSNQTSYPDVIDVVGYNYTESRYVSDHAKYPNRILYGSENRSDYEAWKAVRDNDFIFGQFIWTGADYLGESNSWPSRGFYSGLIDLANNVKPRGRYRAALWCENPVCYIGTYPKNARARQDSFDAWDDWNYTEGQMIRVVCYTNASSARLLLNGREVGELTAHNDKSGIIGWDVPYCAGTLTAEGLDSEGRKVSEYTIKTASRPYSISAKPDNTDVNAGGAVVQIQLEILDENGLRSTLASDNITCTIEGPGKLLGLEAGDNSDMSDYTDNVQRAFKGRLMAYIQTGRGAGDIKVRFSAPYLKGADVTIHSHNYTRTEDIFLSDPFILADDATGLYYMTGTGGQLWKSSDLKLWDGPFTVAQTDPQSWMGPRPMIWAAELHKYNGKYYYFATFTNQAVIIENYRGNDIERRACHILVSDRAEGPYRPMADETYLPADQPTLDATFWVDTDGKPYMLFCHEWLQNWDGTVEKIGLKSDLSGVTGERKLLFKASASPWSRELRDGKVVPNKVTDGPYVFRTQTGKLGMIWTSWKFEEYTQGVAYSENGTLDGPWVQKPKQLTPPNFGHGMIFRTFDGKLLLCCHSHAKVEGRTVRRPAYFLLDDSGDELKVLGRYNP